MKLIHFRLMYTILYCQTKEQMTFKNNSAFTGQTYTNQLPGMVSIIRVSSISKQFLPCEEM